MKGIDQQRGTRPWYLVQLKPHGYRKAERNLKRQAFPVFSPLEQKTRRRGGRFLEELAPLFPGYLFVSFDPETSPWRVINSTYGVARLVSFGGGEPKAVPDELISGLKMRCNPEGRLLPPGDLAKGDRVRIVSGPFADFVTEVESTPARERVYVLLEVMGRSRRTSVPVKDLQKTDDSMSGYCRA